MRNSKKRQQGVTTWEAALYVFVFMFVLTMGVKLGPVYIEDHNIASAIEGVHESVGGGNEAYDLTSGDVRSRLSKFFQVSMLPGELLKEVNVSREGGRVWLKLEYERRIPFVGNVDVVVRFSHEVDLSEPVKK